jgi:hypothetical protein
MTKEDMSSSEAALLVLTVLRLFVNQISLEKSLLSLLRTWLPMTELY